MGSLCGQLCLWTGTRDVLVVALFVGLCLCLFSEFNVKHVVCFTLCMQITFRALVMSVGIEECCVSVCLCQSMCGLHVCVCVCVFVRVEAATSSPVYQEDDLCHNSCSPCV